MTDRFEEIAAVQIMAIQLREAEERIAELETQVDQSQKVISELMAQVAALKKIAEDERAAVLTADICDGGDGYGHLSICGMNAVAGITTRVEERVAMAHYQLAKEHPEVFR